MGEEGSINQLTRVSLANICNRKRCFVCEKLVFLHQPILLCGDCRNVFHGTCLKFNSDKVFILQQLPWTCESCNVDKCVKYNCCTCFVQIDLYIDKITQCKQCFKLLHTSCATSNVCLDCLPDSTLGDIQIDVEAGKNAEFYKNLPYFSPFEFYSREVTNFLPDAEELNDNLQECSQILNSCEYFNTDKFCEEFNSESLSLIALNVDGFKSNFSSFTIFHEKLLENRSNPVDGYLICETNVTESESKHFYLKGYNRFIVDRIFNQEGTLKHKGSGLFIFLRESFNNVIQSANLSVSNPNFEALCIEVSLNKSEKFFLISCYRSPSGNFDSFIDDLNTLLESLNRFKKHKSYIFGDLNVNLYNMSCNTKKYLDCLFSNNFLPLISRATHFGGINSTCIDHILTNDLSKVMKTGVIRCNISRHLPTFLTLNVKVDSKIGQPTITGKPRTRINDFTVQGFMSEIDKLKLDYSLPANKLFTSFHLSFKALYDKWFLKPPTTVSNSTSKYLRSEWISIGVAKSSETKNELFEIWVKNKNKNNWNKYIEYKRVFDCIKNKEKFLYYDKIFKDTQQDLKRTWKCINEILGRKRQNRLLTFTDDDAAHNFNKYFVSIASNLLVETYGNDSNSSSHDFEKFMPEENTETLSDCLFDSKDIEGIIIKLNDNKSTYFSPKVLKLISSKLSPQLAKIFNVCMKDGYFPNELKIAKVIPLYKHKGSINDICNYRPISMLSVFSKIFEKLIHKEMMSFLNANSILSDSQFGFRAKHSTAHALINAISHLQLAMDSGKSALGLFIDFSKAFDTINHRILLDKLEIYGIRGNLHKVLSSYLADRYQYVSYGQISSSLLMLTCGVPQGSVLGPLLFIIFINDIQNASTLAKFILFADDLNVFLENTDRDVLYEQANAVLSDIYEYCKANLLIVNFEKCCFMEFSKNCVYNLPHPKIGVGVRFFKKVECCKFLGVHINKDLKWDDHIDHTIKQVSKSCGSLYSIKKHVPCKVLRQVYLSLIQPYLTYCIQLWGQGSSSALNRLFVLQKKCIRIVCGSSEKVNGSFQHTKPMFFKLKLLSVFNLYSYFCGCFAMSILKSQSPVQIFKLFHVSERSSRLLLPKFVKSKIMYNNFIYNASKILNFLYDNDIPYSILSPPVFKKRLKNHLLNMQNKSLSGDANWLLCNHNLFSDIIIWQ